MRAGPLAVVCILLTARAVLAAEPMAPNDIQATFFDGQPFTASTPGGTKFKMTFTPGGKMTREPLAQSGSKNNGTWKLEHFSLMLTRSLRVGGNWRILPDKLCVGANEFCARGLVSFVQPLFAAVL